jgi:hypothetical protein
MQVTLWFCECERGLPASSRDSREICTSSTVVTVRKGKAVLIAFFWDHAEALEAAVLRE